jgi:sugar phosphate isomerase/epimerase
LDGLEIRSVWDTPPQKLSKDQIVRMKKILAPTELKVCCIASPFYKCDIESSKERQDHIEILKSCIRLAKAFDCTIIRGFTFWRKGNPEDHWKRILEGFPEPIQLLEREGVTLGIENENSTMIGTGKVLRRFLKELGSPRVKAIWDACNSFADDLVKETAYPDGYEAIKSEMVHMHLKDAARDRKTGATLNMPVGEGEIDFKNHMKALLRDGYAGYVSLETHWRPKQLSREEIDRPGGASYSKDGEYASRRCLENWHKIMDSLK